MLGYRGDLTIPKLFHQCWRDSGFPKDMFNWRWQVCPEFLGKSWTLRRFQVVLTACSDDYSLRAQPGECNTSTRCIVVVCTLLHGLHSPT